MNDNYSWKKSKVVEADLIDLLLKLCRQWKPVLVCAIVLACLLGIYSYINSGKSRNVEISIEDIELTKDEQQRVDGAVELAEEIAGTKKYLDESIVMNIDPYRKDKVTLLYSIDDATKSTKQKIVDSYLTFLTSGGAVEKLQNMNRELEKIDENYLSELISAWQKSDSSYQIVVNATSAETLFYIEVTGKDEEMAAEIADGMQEIVSLYNDTVKKNAGEHTLTLLSKVQGVKIDSSLATQQHDKNYQLSADISSLKNLTDSFSEEQKLVYEDRITSDKEKAEKENVTGGVIGKWVVLGFIGGAFIYCVIFACFYMLRDTVKRMEELKRYYNFPVYGGIILKKGTKGTGEDLAGKQKDEYDRQKAQMVNRVKLACQKQGFSKMCLATDFSLNQQEKCFIDSLSKQLKDWGIDIVLGENIVGNVSVWDDMKQIGNVLMVYKIGVTTHRIIDEEMCFYTENNIEVLGAVTIEAY